VDFLAGWDLADVNAALLAVRRVSALQTLKMSFSSPLFSGLFLSPAGATTNGDRLCLKASMI
jgi:hypothetical protein